MALIQRPVKQFGFRTYDADFNAAPLNPTPPPTHLYEIQTAEVDGDIDTVYAAVNGSLDTTNLSPTASILGSQLAVGAAVHGTAIATTNVLAIAGLEVTEHTWATLPPLPCRGGPVLLALSPSGSFHITVTDTLQAPPASFFAMRLKRDGTIIQTWTLSVGSGAMGITVAGDPTATMVFDLFVPFPSLHFLETPIAGAHVYSWTMQQTVVSGTVNFIAADDTGAGHTHAVELS